MTGSAILDLLMARLGNRTESALRALCLTEMNLVVHNNLERAGERFWFQRQDDSSTYSTVASQETVTISNLLGFDEEWGEVYVYDADSELDDKWVRLARDNWKRLRERSGANETGIPEVYSIINKVLYLRPIPDDVYQLRIFAYFKDSDITDSSAETTWLINAPDVVLAETGIIMASVHLQHPELAQEFRAASSLARSSLMMEVVASRSEGKELIMEGE